MSVSLHLEAEDNQDALTVRVTVTGSLGGTVNLFAQQVDLPGTGDGVWESVGSIVGNGIATAFVGSVLGICSCWIYAVEGGVISLPVLTSCTGGAAVATRCRRSVVSVLLTLNLPDIGGNIFERAQPTLDNISKPCVILSPSGFSEAERMVLNNRDDIVYPLVLAIVTAHKLNDNQPLPQVEKWRQAIGRAFRNQRLLGVAESITVVVENLVIAKPPSAEEQDGYQNWISGMVLRCHCREPRGINV